MTDARDRILNTPLEEIAVSDALGDTSPAEAGEIIDELEKRVEEWERRMASRRVTERATRLHWQRDPWWVPLAVILLSAAVLGWLIGSVLSLRRDNEALTLAIVGVAKSQYTHLGITRDLVGQVRRLSPPVVVETLPYLDLPEDFDRYLEPEPEKFPELRKFFESQKDRPVIGEVPSDACIYQPSRPEFYAYWEVLKQPPPWRSMPIPEVVWREEFPGEKTPI